MIDFHNHLIPGVDDGAADLDQARTALDAMQTEGVTSVVATPHLRASLTAREGALTDRLAEIDAGWDALRSLSRGGLPGVRLERGVELTLDARAPDLSDPRLRLAGTSFVLVEFAAMTIPPRSSEALFELTARGWNPILAHPERYLGVGGMFDVVERWCRSGVRLQVNGGSLLGRYGPEAEKVAWELLGRGWVDYLCSDYHARGRPSIRDVRTVLEQAGGEQQVALLMRENAARLLADLAPEPVPPLARRVPVWRRLLRKHG